MTWAAGKGSKWPSWAQRQPRTVGGHSGLEDGNPADDGLLDAGE